MCEILWSDPGPNKGRMPSKRGVGVQFGADVTKAFLQLNSLGGQKQQVFSLASWWLLMSSAEAAELWDLSDELDER